MKSKIVVFLSLLIGGIAFFIGSCNLYNLYGLSKKMAHTSGVVTNINTEKIYRHRKNTYKRTASIEYKANGRNNRIRRELYNPFISKGSEISLWYNPNRTGEIILPSRECLVWGSIWVFGLLCILSGFVILKTKRV